MKTFLFRSIIGIFFGAFLAVIVTNSVVYFGNQDMLDGQVFMKNSLGSIFCGWFFTVSPLYFENTRLRLSQQTALHFATVVVSYFILAFGIGWIPFTLKSFLVMFAMFIFIYFIFWTAFYLYFRKQAQKLNAELNGL
ncbi:DUF3021 domain-containing protein [Sporosarcina sp. 6E9]|uniref:DUF3021 domain-containing protein n=1 Tax=Sporosarcina sp. 6E9 TaxID=2819235 RepID=UPI001AC26584|nr:DUF3021 domain-containing protein [Microvirga sp. 3-52]